jgi:YebC/PmpR family DNA-binding regulatory protein
MSGHSKWAQIKRKKASSDAKRGTVFTKLSRAITIAAKQGGSDPAMNVSLRLAIDRAKKENMPQATIERALQKVAGPGVDMVLEEATIEAFGPSSSTLLIKTISDNKNRSLAEVKHMLQSHDFTLGAKNSAGWMYNHVGQIDILLAKNSLSAEDIELAAIDNEASDIRTRADRVVVFTSVARTATTKAALEQLGIVVDSMRIVYVPQTSVSLNAHEEDRVRRIIEELTGHDDVMDVFCNVDFASS